jgi:hypothetical protein
LNYVTERPKRLNITNGSVKLIHPKKCPCRQTEIVTGCSCDLVSYQDERKIIPGMRVMDQNFISDKVYYPVY